ncbi:radical SAM protein, partial [Pontibacter sp. E15-1]|nr:radical SAM protein [Pontibacter sp. E15-1]
MVWTIKSLQKQEHAYADPLIQLDVLQQPSSQGEQFPAFAGKLRAQGLFPLRPTSTSILQVNMGKMCNQTCKHCHVDAGP